jgi:uncharacterized membrane protein
VVITRAERFKRLLVWHPINTDPHDDDRWTVRFWLPLFDCLVILAGIIAYSFGSRIMSKLFPEWIVDWAAVVFAIAGFITLVGVCIPRLWRVEVGGKITIAFLLTTYAFLVLTFPQYDQNNAFVCVILIMATWGIYPRLTRLFVRGLHDKAQRKAVKSWARSK